MGVDPSATFFLYDTIPTKKVFQVIDGGNMSLTPTGGSVGIGTSSPLSALQVNGRETVDDTGYFALMANATFPGTDKYLANGYAGRIAFANSNGYWSLETAPSGTAGATVPYVSRFAVSNLDNVGIGTTTPSAPLEITPTSPGAAKISLYNNSGDEYGLGINAGEISLFSGTSGGIDFLTGGPTGTSKLFIANGGDVGVGTTSPRQQLSVGSYLDIYSGGVASPSVASIRAGSTNST